MAENVTKKVEAVAAAATADVKKQQEELDKKIKESTKSYDTFIEAMKNYRGENLRGLNEIIVTTARLNVDVQKLAQANKDGYEYLLKRNKTEVEANAKQIEALSKNAEKQEELLKAYEKKNELIVQNGLIAKAELEEEYRNLEASLEKNEYYEERIVQLREERDNRIRAIAKETLNQTYQNSAEMHTVLEQQSKASVDKIIEHAGEVVKHTGGLWKGVIDVGAQKEHLDTAKNQLTDYLTSLKTFGQEQLAEYDKQLADTSLSFEERQTIIEQRNAFEVKHNKFLADETKRVNKELETIEKSSQNLRLQQFKEYGEKATKITKEIAAYTQTMTKSFIDVLDQMSTNYGEKAKELGEEITSVEDERKNKLAEVALTEEERQTREEELAQEKINLENATTEEQKNKSQERIDTLQTELGAEENINSEYDQKKADLEKEKEKTEARQRKADNLKKKVDLGQKIVQAIADVASGAANALSYGPFLGPVLAAMVTALGAVQIGLMTKQLVKFEDGGLLRGRRHSEGGMPILGSNIEVEGGEYVVNRQSTGKNLGLLHYINSQRRPLSSADMDDFFASAGRRVQPSFAAMMEEGGQLPAMLNTAQPDGYMLMDAIQSIKFEPKVSVTDINSAQSDVVKVDSWVGM